MLRILLKNTKKRKKSTYKLFIASFFGWHYVYLEGWGKAFLFWVTGGGVLVWWLADFFRVPKLVRESNEEAAQEVAKDIKMLS